MFVHAVHFHVAKRHADAYKKDCRMWAAYAKRYPGFRACYTFKREGYKDEYVSIYMWDSKKDNDRFMRELHDQLVEESKAVVRPKGYYNLCQIYRSRNEIKKG